MTGLLDIASWVLLMLGGFLGITGAVGLFRFPDFYTRLHAASVTDTLCAGLIVLGLMLQATSAMMIIKLLMILLILTYTSPTAAHALAKSAIHGRVRPLLDEGNDSPSTPSSTPPSTPPPPSTPTTTAPGSQPEGGAPSTP